MTNTIQTWYEVKKAHSQISGNVLKKSEVMQDIVRWLKTKTNPYNYDVNVINWDGKDVDIFTETGDEFIKIYEGGQKIATL